ncbi:hypothetical protein [Bacillus safensis]|uniref:hypothetical protein n=1 Tax=Bacillus safensis TaxID=561879 RepID=UPI001CCCAF28|nr:hypothetical protein [Bacillus safensis]MBZ9521900.1 hypothetical protein [Bacillus safensis]
MSNLRIQKKMWNKLSDDEKKEIETILKRAGSIEENSVIEPHDQSNEEHFSFPNPIEAICKSACDVTYGLAATECQKLSGDAQAVCLIAASVARDACRNKC